jgi:hypothetical protein
MSSLSPSCRLYPPACKPYGLEAGPEAGPGSLLDYETMKVRKESRYVES